MTVERCPVCKSQVGSTNQLILACLAIVDLALADLTYGGLVGAVTGVFGDDGFDDGFDGIISKYFIK